MPQNIRSFVELLVKQLFSRSLVKSEQKASENENFIQKS